VIILGSLVVLVIFLGTGWAIATEMFQQRTWRRRVASGDTAILVALIEEALVTWRRARPPKGVSSSLWAGVQGVQLVAVTEDTATVSTSAEGEFRTESGQRVQVSTALDEAIALAAKVADMMLYDVPNLHLSAVRVDVYATFGGEGGVPVQRPILTTDATRADADTLAWETMTAGEILGRFATVYRRGETGQGLPIELPPIEGGLPAPGRVQGEG